MTPAYCIASRDVVERIQSVCGEETSIIFLMHDPVDRDYSQLNQYFHIQRGAAQAKTVSEYLSLLARPGFVSRSGYISTLDRWSSVFGRDRVLVEFYDNLAAYPLQTLQRITEFIGVAFAPGIYKRTIEERVYASIDGPVMAPERIKTLIAARQIGNLEQLAKRFPIAEQWLRRAVTLLDNR